ncbi:hypothetical protein P3T76_002485 [Phytophthora citrophthora]|uniref:Uncharacterized protein n=1 Tax=Phytophthora citrophthora TaxID=4793 RepID=A0AAD9GVA6_9STRA|nr:hypothetical protein P3T76_002485 [Phytophthora citrophthora]
MSTSIRKQQRKEKVLEWAMRPHWMPRDVNGRLISHDHLRFYEKGFPKLAYFEGVPFVPWRALQAKVLKPHGWDQFQGHFRGEHLIVGDNGLRTMSHANIYGEGNHTCNGST